MRAMKEWAEIAGIALLCVAVGIFGVVVVVGVIAAWAAAMGAVVGALFGGIAGGAVIGFKWILAVAAWWL